MQNHAAQQTSRYHNDHTHESHLVGLVCDAGQDAGSHGSKSKLRTRPRGGLSRHSF